MNYINETFFSNLIFFFFFLGAVYESINIVKENPYRLAHDIFGIGFLTADKIAQKLGFDENSSQRAEAGILHVLHELADEGHVFYEFDLLIEKAQEILNVEKELLNTALKSLEIKKKIVIEELSNEDTTKVGVFLSGYHMAEQQTAKLLSSIRDTANNL